MVVVVVLNKLLIKSAVPAAADYAAILSQVCASIVR